MISGRRLRFRAMHQTYDIHHLRMPSTIRPIAMILLLATCACAATGCSAPRVNTPFLQSVDLVDMTDRMAESFSGSDVIATRSVHATPWVISVYRVVNHTNQIIPEREKWLYIGRLRAMLARSDVSKRHGLIWIVPPERWPQIAEAMNADVGAEPPNMRMKPTHLLTAEFSSLTNTSAAGRSDAYVCEFELIDLATGRIVWTDSWEVKRAVRGLTYD